MISNMQTIHLVGFIASCLLGLICVLVVWVLRKHLLMALLYSIFTMCFALSSYFSYNQPKYGDERVSCFKHDYVEREVPLDNGGKYISFDKICTDYGWEVFVKEGPYGIWTRVFE